MRKISQLAVPIIVTLILVPYILIIFPTWTSYEKLAFIFVLFSAAFLVSKEYLRIRDESIIDEEYDKVIANPFDCKFVIPPKSIRLFQYYPQDEENHVLTELDVPKKSTIVIMLRIKPKLDLEVRDSQYSFSNDGGKKKPIINMYENLFYDKGGIKWFEEDLKTDWWGNYHLSGKRIMFKDVAYMDGFEITTYDKGSYTFNMEYVVVAKNYNGMSKEKTKDVRSQLKINIV